MILPRAEKSTFKKFVLTTMSGSLIGAAVFYFFPKSSSVISVQTEKANPSSEATPMPIEINKVDGDKQAEILKNFSRNEEKKWRLISDVLTKKTDNDPLVDAELINLSPELKEKIIETYQKTPMEDRNGRGFLAFLISRDLNSAKDIEFLRSIYEEQPCLSLSNCSANGVEDPHLDSINNVSLNYPQMVTLYQINKKIQTDPSIFSDQSIRAEIDQLLREARQFPGVGLSTRVDDIERSLILLERSD
jgi:hypothetical protein